MMPPNRLDDLLQPGDPDRPALTYKDQTLTYGELSRRVAAAAKGLRALGLRPGERVVIYLEKRIEAVVAMLAVSAVGGVIVPVNPVFKPSQVRHVVADCAARLLVTTVERYRTLLGELMAGGAPEHVVLVGEPDTSVLDAGLVPWRMISWSQLNICLPASGTDSADGTEVAAIFYTSGSTGGPKGVIISHRNLIVGAQSVAGYLGHTCDDVVLSVLPLSFDAGFSQLSTSLVAGAHVVLVNYLLPREVVRLCATYRVTALTCVPPLWLQLAAQQWPPESTRHLRYFANTGGHLPQPTLDRLREVFPTAKPYLMYGLTEAFRSTYLDPAQVDRRPDSIGKAIPNAEILVVRPDGSGCDPGEHGELVHRGPLVTLGYWNDPERTAERFRPFPPIPAGADPSGAELAVWSGDVVYRDEEGFIYFVGRTDDMIKTSGYRVSPTEIEEAAYASGLVDEAAAFGVPDERLGQHVVLAVTGAGDLTVLRKALDHDLPAYMMPKRIVPVAEIPRSGNGKFDRNELRRQVSE